MKKMKKIFIAIGIFVVLILGFIIYSVKKDTNQAKELDEELINFVAQDFLKDDFDIAIKTKGDYGYIEERVKNYYKNMSDIYKEIYKNLSDSNFESLIMPSSLIHDRPNYSNSYAMINNTRENLNSLFQQIAVECNEDTIKNLLDKEKLSDPDYYYDFYLKMMYDEGFVKENARIQSWANNTQSKANNLLDKELEILKFLSQNDDVIKMSDEQIYIPEGELLNEYRDLITDLNQIAQSIKF